MIGCPLRAVIMFMMDWCWNTFVKASSFHVWPRAFMMILIFLLWITCQMRVILCCNVVSHRLNTKETLPKFSRNLTLNHIGESLGSRGGKLRENPLLVSSQRCSKPRQIWLSISVPKLWDLVFKTDPDVWKIFPRFRNSLDHCD